MSCLISFVWDQSTCQERIESDKIQNENSLTQSGTRNHSLEICSAVLYRLSYPGFDESCAIKVFLMVMTFIYTCTCGEWEGGPVNQVNHTSWVAVVTPTDRPKSVRNCCLIELFCGVVCVVTLPF